LKKKLILILIIFIIGVLTVSGFYYYYFRKAVIYDLVNIEFQGIPSDNSSAIHIYGITPLNKRIKISKKENNNRIPGCYQAIEIEVPDTITSRISSVRILLAEKTYYLNFDDLYLKELTDMKRVLVLPPQISSSGSLLKKTLAVFPIVSTINKNIIPFFPIIYIASVYIFIWTLVLWSIRIIKKRNKKFSSNIVLNENIFNQSFVNIFLPFLIFIISFFWKLCYIKVPYVWFDETGMIFNAQHDLRYIIQLPARWEANPPLFMLIVHFWIKIFGISPESIRIIPLLFNSLTAVVMYLIGRKFFSFWSGIMAAGIFMFSTYHFYFALETRPYSMVSLETALSLFFFLSLINNYKSRKHLIALILINTLLIYTHYFGWFVILTEFILSWCYLGNRTLFKKLLLSMLITGILFIPITPSVFKMFLLKNESSGNLPDPPANSEYLQQLFYFLNNRYIVVFFLLAMLAGIIITLKLKTFKENYRKIIILFFWWFIPYTLMFCISKKIPMFTDRYILFNSIGLYLFVVITINYLFQGQKKYFIGLLFLILMFYQLNPVSWHCCYSLAQNSMDSIKKKADEKSIVIIYPFYNSPQFVYYYNKDFLKNIDKYDSLLEKNRIFPVRTLEKAKEKLNKYKGYRVIYSQYYTDKKIYNYLDSTYTKTDSIFYTQCLDISVFEPYKTPGPNKNRGL